MHVFIFYLFIYLFICIYNIISLSHTCKLHLLQICRSNMQFVGRFSLVSGYSIVLWVNLFVSIHVIIFIYLIHGYSALLYWTAYNKYVCFLWDAKKKCSFSFQSKLIYFVGQDSFMLEEQTQKYVEFLIYFCLITVNMLQNCVLLQFLD